MAQQQHQEQQHAENCPQQPVGRFADRVASEQAVLETIGPALITASEGQ
jgi:hypothetical protein